MIRLGSVVVNCADREVMAEFWSAALHLEPADPGESGRFQVLTGPRVNLSLQVADNPVSCRDQMHLDLYTDDQAGEVQRLQGLGARYVRQNDDPDDDYVVMQDPEGNEFCVIAAE